MTKAANLISQKFNRLTVIRRVENNKFGQAQWETMCECGTICVQATSTLVGGQSKSCGCLKRELASKRWLLRPPVKTIHGYTSDGQRCKEYNAWVQMKYRCYNKDNKGYHLWGGRGITVCDEWRDNFPAFYKHIGDAPSASKSISVDRINNDGNYEPGNVRWATDAEQGHNTRLCKLSMEKARAIRANANNKSRAELAKEYGVHKDSIRGVINNKIWKEPQ